MVRQTLGALGLAWGAISLAGCSAPEQRVPTASVPAATSAVQTNVAAAQNPAPPIIPKPPVMPKLDERNLVRSNFAGSPTKLTVEAEEVPASPTAILNPAAAERLFGNSGITLQWISWEKRGRVWIAVDDTGVWWLTGGQEGKHGDVSAGRLKLEGAITEIGADYFILNGTIKMQGAPDAERSCSARKQWRFAVTQNRKYWRLREFEWCDGLTDYIDIYL